MEPPAIASQIKSLARKLQGDEPYWRFDQILQLERAHKAPSVFFLLNEPPRLALTPLQMKLYSGRYRVELEPVATLVRELVSKGCEVGLHASYNSAEHPPLFVQEKQLLERVANREVTGIRQHYFRLQGDKAWQLQVAAGFQYDCSVGSSRTPGFVCGTMMPFRPWPRGLDVQLGILEIPTTMVDTAVMYESMATLRPRRDTTDVVQSIIHYAEYVGGVVNVLWHSHLFSEEDYPGATELYRQILLECSKRGAWFATLTQLGTWWREHTTAASNLTIEVDHRGNWAAVAGK